MSKDEVHAKSLTLQCVTCAAMPGQQCTGTLDQRSHEERRISARKALKSGVSPEIRIDPLN